MFSKSYKNGKIYKIDKDRRFKERKEFTYDISFPVVNGKSYIEEQVKTDGYVIKTTDITEYGIGIRSNIILNKGDFLNLSIKVDGSPIFECMCIVKWVGVDDKSYIAGCEFCNIRNEDRNYIRNFMNLKEE